MREERAREGSEYGALIEDYITNGKIVPVEITCSLLENAMIKTKEVMTFVLLVFNVQVSRDFITHVTTYRFYYAMFVGDWQQ